MERVEDGHSPLVWWSNTDLFLAPIHRRSECALAKTLDTPHESWGLPTARQRGTVCVQNNVLWLAKIISLYNSHNHYEHLAIPASALSKSGVRSVTDVIADDLICIVEVNHPHRA